MDLERPGRLGERVDERGQLPGPVALEQRLQQRRRWVRAQLLSEPGTSPREGRPDGRPSFCFAWRLPGRYRRAVTIGRRPLAAALLLLGAAFTGCGGSSPPAS